MYVCVSSLRVGGRRTIGQGEPGALSLVNLNFVHVHRTMFCVPASWFRFSQTTAAWGIDHLPINIIWRPLGKFFGHFGNFIDRRYAVSSSVDTITVVSKLSFDLSSALSSKTKSVGTNQSVICHGLRIVKLIGTKLDYTSDSTTSSLAC